MHRRRVHGNQSEFATYEKDTNLVTVSDSFTAWKNIITMVKTNASFSIRIDEEEIHHYVLNIKGQIMIFLVDETLWNIVISMEDGNGV